MTSKCSVLREQQENTTHKETLSRENDKHLGRDKDPVRVGGAGRSREPN